MDLLTPDIPYLVLLHWKHSRSTSTFFIFSGEIRTYFLKTKNARLFQPSDLNLYKSQVLGCMQSHHYMKNPEKNYSYRLCGKSYTSEGLIWIYQNVFCRERNILETVNKIAPKFQEGLKAYSDSPIIGEVRFCSCICLLNTYIWHMVFDYSSDWHPLFWRYVGRGWFLGRSSQITNHRMILFQLAGVWYLVFLWTFKQKERYCFCFIMIFSLLDIKSQLSELILEHSVRSVEC